MRSKLFLSAFMLLAMHVFCGELPRRVYLGVRMENLTDDAKRIMNLAGLNGVLISEVFPKSTAEQAGFRKGDILLKIDSAGFSSTATALSYLATRKAGESFRYELVRNKKKIKGQSVFSSFPEEKYTGLEVIYTETKTVNGLQRIIITKPETAKKLPVIAFIGGIGCYSLDLPLDSSRAEVQLMNRLSRAGYLCARLEKPGMGDNANFCKPCNKVSFMEETSGYIAAINTLKQRADVDSNSVFIIGHSMGGVFAPLIAQQTAIKGIVAYGTLGSNFLEYLAKTRRTIGEAYAMAPEETDKLVKDFCECSALYFASKLSTAEAASQKAVCAEYLAIFDLRARTYNDELYALNIPAVWKPYTGKVLLMWGESDYVASRDDHRILSEAINFYHKDHAQFITVAKADHGMSTASSFSEAVQNPGPYNETVSSSILAWLKEQA